HGKIQRAYEDLASPGMRNGRFHQPEIRFFGQSNGLVCERDLSIHGGHWSETNTVRGRQSVNNLTKIPRIQFFIHFVGYIPNDHSDNVCKSVTLRPTAKLNVLPLSLESGP